MKVNLVKKQVKKPFSSEERKINIKKILSLDTLEELEALKSKLKDQIKNNTVTFCEIEQVVNVLESPIIKRNDKGEPVVNQRGEVIAEPLGIRQQRQINRILDAIEKKEGTKGDIIIEISEEDVIYLADRMMAHCNSQIVPSKCFIELYDKFLEYKSQAKLATEKKKSGA